MHYFLIDLFENKYQNVIIKFGVKSNSIKYLYSFKDAEVGSSFTHNIFL